ncbi:MAG TPA: amidohydrolase family protein [Acidimicrobiia bacterium]|nr:amidohydrolase family protein [Acidimicrobiia bacterium]
MDRFVADILLTMADEHTAPIRRGAVDVDQGRVVWSGPVDTAPERDAPVHQVDGILMPGMVDIHCHTPMLLLRGAGEGLPVDRWLHEVMWPREARLTADDVRAAMRVGAAELLGNGITTSVEMYFHGQAVAEGASEVGMRSVVTAPIIEDAQLSGFGRWEDQVDEMLAMAERWATNELIEVGLGPHAAWSVSDACLRRLSEISAEMEMLVHIHVAEQEWEDAAVREKTGLAAPAYLDSLGLLDGRILAAHGVWLTDEDISLLGRKHASVAHCPCSNTKHASGVARVADMTAAGIKVGIATDGPASHHRLDLFEEMRTAIRLARVRSGDAQQFDTDTALWMTTAGAADAIGRFDLGRLTPGARADMVALSGSSALHPVIEEEDDPVARVVWSGSPSAVTSVWVGGNQVVESGAVTTIDRAAAVRELDERAERLAR